MEDLAYLEEFLAEPAIIEESPKPSALDSLKVPGSDVSPNVNIVKGEQAQNALDAKKNQKSLFDTAKGAKDQTEKVLGSAVPSLDELPIPSGGIGLLLFLALVLVFAISKPEGQDATRLQLVWGSILGNYQYAAQSASSANPSPSSFPAPSSTLPGLPAYIQGGGGVY